MKKLIITQISLQGGKTSNMAAALCQDRKLLKLDFETPKNALCLNDIYVGKVSNIAKNIQAAFVEIQKGIKCYLSLSDLQNPIFVNKKGKKPLVQGDELLVQLIKEPLKTKAATVTANLNFAGKYVVLTTGKRQFGISSKLSRERGTHIKALFSPFMEEEREFGVIVRTNAEDASDETLLHEYHKLKLQAETFLKHAAQRTCYSKVYEEKHGILNVIKNTYMSDLSDIVTDDKDMYQQILDYLTVYQPEDLDKLHFYEDRLLPLYKLYNLPLQIEGALQKHVWLKSGGYIIIEPTEAMVVIDVNTGKFEGGKKDKEAAFLKINKEAAKEIARQLQLRNLSGMILIDFISMQEKEAQQELTDYLINELKADSTATNFIDITKLGIVELTRKKQKKSLAETIRALYYETKGH